jgi:hypothetical protein
MQVNPNAENGNISRCLVGGTAMQGTIVVLILMIAFGTGEAVACSCLPPTVVDARRRADIVFVGTVKAVTFLEPHTRGSRVIVTFDINRVWKGRVTKQFEMRSIVETTFCEGFFEDDLKVGKELLVFGNRVLSGLRYTYTTNICTLTGPADRQASTVEQLGESKPPQ